MPIGSSRAITALALLLLVSCVEATAPPTERITLDMCDPRWIAYQNDGAPWRLLGQGPGVYTFAASRRLAVARALFSLNSSIWHVYIDYLTPEQAVAKLSCNQDTLRVPGMLRGTITGLSGLQVAYVYLGGYGAFVQAAAYTEYRLDAQPAAATLVAVRHVVDYAPANRIIIRRDQWYREYEPIPLLDFNSAEGFAPQVNTLSFTGSGATAYVDYVTGGRSRGLSYVHMGSPGDPVMPRTGPAVYSIPAAHRIPSDIHRMQLTSGGQKAEHYYRDGSDRTLALGPPLATETFTTMATQPYRRIRVEVPSQPEYGAEIYVEMSQRVGGRWSDVNLTATREYFGETPAVWSLTLPDLSGLAGFQLANALTDGQVRVVVTATNRRFGLSNTNAQDDETVLSASRTSTIP